MSAQIINHGYLTIAELKDGIAKHKVAKMGICRRFVDRDGNEDRGFVTYYDVGKYYYTRSYSSTDAMMPTNIFRSKLHDIDKSFSYQTASQTIDNYIANKNRYIDVDIATLSKLVMKPVVSSYINMLPVDTVSNLVYTHCVLTMNVQCLELVPAEILPVNHDGFTNLPASDKDKIAQFRVECQEMKQKLFSILDKLN